ncbi:MAG: transposase [Planctomycetota bacterium]
MQFSDPLAYFMTFTTHGTWLHGDERGSVDEEHNAPGTPYITTNKLRVTRNRERLKTPEFLLSKEAREVVDAAIQETCEHRGWTLKALNVRSNHVHMVVVTLEQSIKVMNDCKAWATRKLRAVGLASSEQRVWTRRGSCRKLFTAEAVRNAVDYTMNRQDRPAK